MSELQPLPQTPPGRYRHYKGGEYDVMGVARHSETHEPLVVYRPLYNDSGWWVRPHAMFFGMVEVNGLTVLRFARVQEAGMGDDVRAADMDAPGSSPGQDSSSPA